MFEHVPTNKPTSLCPRAHDETGLTQSHRETRQSHSLIGCPGDDCIYPVCQEIAAAGGCPRILTPRQRIIACLKGYAEHGRSLWWDGERTGNRLFLVSDEEDRRHGGTSDRARQRRT